MANLTIPEAYEMLRGVGFSEPDAVNMTAIGLAESGLNPEAIGDVTLENRTWGPSVGMFQERTLKAEYGRVTIRDEHWLLETPVNQCKAAYQTSDGGRVLTPWSTWLHGSAQARLSEVRSALGHVTSTNPVVTTGGTTDMLTIVRGESKAAQVIKAGVWQTLALANPFSMTNEQVPIDVVLGEVYLGITDLAPGSTIQIRPYSVIPDGKVLKFVDSYGIDERAGTTGSTFIKSHITGHVPAKNRLRIAVAITGQAEVNIASTRWTLNYQK